MKKHTSSITSMNRRDFMKVAGGAMLAFTHCVSDKKNKSRQKPANILLIITDQQHIDTLASSGCPYVKTPALDRLKERGVSFRLSYSPNPLCSPARASIFTGRTPAETGVIKNTLSIRSDIPNMGQWFSENSNYETFYAGKLHLPEPYTRSVPGFKMLCGGGQIGYVYDEMVSRACEGFLRNRSSNKPFFLVASFTQPHDVCIWLRENFYNVTKLRYGEIRDELPPLPGNFDFDPDEIVHIKDQRATDEPVPGKWDKLHWRYYRWSYYRQIEDLDGEIGRVLQTCEDTGCLENTLIIFTSDHGEGLGHHQMVRKSSPYDESIKVPFIISWPGHIPEDQEDIVNLVSGMDIMPTCCDYAGISLPPQTRGKSLKPILEGNPSNWRTHLISELAGNAVRMVRSSNYKYIIDLKDRKEMLFNMKNDAGETKNIAGSDQADSIIKDHRRALREWENGLDVAGDIPYRDDWRSI